jgi:3-hydroxyisobutyrate dehydrogenase-like beta-hydroxyacid dehydrogenase
MTHLAVLGTGKMGGAIARRLAEIDPDIALWNRTQARAAALGIGLVAATPADAVRGSDIVISSLTGPDAVRAAYLGPGGALVVHEPILYVEMSTAGPDLVDELASRVRGAGGRLVDAPILGAPAVVASGSAAVLVGGDATDVEEARPVLARLGEVRHVGRLGSAARLKLVANSMLATVVVAAAELQVAGEKAGLAPDQVFWALARIAPVLAPRRAGYLEDRHQPAQFAVRDLRKDVRLALHMFEASGAAVPLTTRISSRVDDATAGWANDDITAVIRAYRPGAGAGSNA